jgi:WD40 repeat protein
MTPCPSPDRLDEWVNERLDPAEQAALAAHIDGCANCQAALDRMTADTRPAAPAADPGFDAALRQLKETLPGRPAVAADGDRPLLPGYDLLEVVGRGGMGVVYRARQRGVNREVAVKLLHRGAADGEDAARFRREGEALGKLRHPNVVQVFDVGVADGRPYLVMEYVPGGPLSRRADGRPLPPADAAAVVEGVARAVQHAHDHGILHRDLKPGNILLSGVRNQEPGITDPSSLAPDSWPLTPKVADFGLARSIDPGESVTLTGVIVGTPSYMAPEQVAGDGRLTPACDVYGLGAVLYELLTGRPPFAGASPADVLLQVRHQDPVPPGRVIPTLPRDLNTVCLKCLEKEPPRRYPSAAAVAEDLRRWRAGEPILARPAGPAEKAWKWARRRKAAATAVGLALFLLLVGLPTVTALWVWAESARRRAADNFDRADRNLYAAHIAQAENHYQLSDPLRMRSHLDACEPAPSGKDRRGWEWAYLRGLVNAEHRDLDLGELPDAAPRALYAVAFDPTGRLVAAGGGPLGFTQTVGDEPGQFGAWDVATGEPALAPAGEDRAIVALAFGPAGRLFTASAHVHRDEPGTVRLRDARTGAPVWTATVRIPVRIGSRRLPPPPVFVVGPDGARVAVQTTDGVIVLDAQTGQPVFGVPGADTAAFRDGGAELVTVGPTPVRPAGLVERLGLLARRPASSPGALRVRVHDAATGADREEHQIDPPGTPIRVLAPSGRRLARVMPDGDILVGPADGAGPDVRVRPPRAVTVMAIDPADRVLVTGGPDGTVRVWDLETGRLRRVFFGHTQRLTAVAVSPDGTRVASVGWDRVVKVWDLTGLPGAGNVGSNPQPGVHRVEDCAFAPDGRELLVVRVPAGELERWDPAADVLRGTARLDLPPDTKGVVVAGRTAALSAGGARVAAAMRARRVVGVWDAAHPAGPVATLAAAPDPAPDPEFDRSGRPYTYVRFVAISPDGTRVAAAVWSGTRPADVRVRAWDVAGAPRVLLDVPLPDHKCTALAFGPDGRRLAAGIQAREAGPGDPDGRVRRWDLDAGAEEPALDCGEYVGAVAYDRAGTRLAAATAGPRVLVWDAAAGRPITEIRALAGYEDLAFAPDGQRLAGASREVLTLWDPATGDEVLTLRGVPRGAGDPPFNPRIAFDATGTRLAVSQWDNTINVWSAPGYGQK